MHTVPQEQERSLLRNGNFQALWISRFFAGLGKETAEVAYPLLTLAMTGAATYAGTIGAIQVFTASVMAIPGGILADRFDRKRLLLLCDLVRAVLLTVFAVMLFTVGVNIPIVLAISLCSAACLGLSNPVGLAAIKQLVPPAQVASAAAQNQARFFTTTVVGPPIGGALFAIARGFPFLAEAISYVVSATLLTFIRKPLQAARETSARTWSWTEVTSGLRFIVKEPTVRAMMIWIVGFNMAFTHTGAFIALIATAQSRGASSSLIGLMISMAGISGLIGAFSAGPILKRARPPIVFITAAWAAPVGAVLLAFMPGTLLLGIILGLVFALVPSINALVFGHLAAAVPDDLQGRVLGAVTFLSLIAQPLGILGIGVIFDAAGARWVFLTMAVAAAAAALPTLTRPIRRLPRPEEIATD